MKKIFLLGLATIFFVACQNKPQRYTQQSAEIDTLKSMIKDYNSKNYESLASHYADTSKTRFNSTEMPSADVVNYHKRNDENYSSRGFIDDNQEYEMVVDDEGKTWVNFWGTWKGTLAANNQEITTHIHLTARFIDGKVVEDYGYWDPSELILALQKIESDKQAEMENKNQTEE